MRHFWIKKAAAVFCALLLCGCALLPSGAVFATSSSVPVASSSTPTPTPTALDIMLITPLPATQTVQLGQSVKLAVVAEVTGGNPSKYTLHYQWYKNGEKCQNAEGTTSSYTVTSNEIGNYTLRIDCTEKDKTEIIKTVVAQCSVTLPTGGSGSLYVTAYAVQDANGNEKQHIGVGEKCQIVVGVRDGRFTSIPTKTDAYGNIANFKITTTTSFATPTFGDIRMTSPKMVDGELEYAIVFNDIMYTGGENKLGIDVAYNDQSIAMQNLSVGISQCFNPAAVSTTKPTVMVRDFSFGGANVSAGTTFTLNLNSYNTSQIQGISDVTTTVTLPATITIAGGSNVALHPVVAPSGAFTDTFQLHVQNSAETGVANVTVAYSFYVQGTETPITSTQVVAVPIVQPDRFSFTSLDVPDEMYAGEENTITVNYVNKGKGILYNVSAEIAGNIDNPGQGQYMGNLNSGTEGSVDFAVKTDGIGPVSGVITISYEDVNGTVKKQTQEFSAQMLPAHTGGDMPIMPDIEAPQEEAGMPWWGWTLIGLGGVGGAAAVVAGVKKAKAKKRAAELADSEDDEE